MSRRLSSGGAEGMSCPTVPAGAFPGGIGAGDGTAIGAGDDTAIGAPDFGAEALNRAELSITRSRSVSKMRVYNESVDVGEFYAYRPFHPGHARPPATACHDESVRRRCRARARRAATHARTRQGA